jgi:hypothetical protein
MLVQIARNQGVWFEITSRPLYGAMVRVAFQFSHIHRQPWEGIYLGLGHPDRRGSEIFSCLPSPLRAPGMPF